MTDFKAEINKAYGVTDRSGRGFLTALLDQLRVSLPSMYEHSIRVGKLAEEFALQLGVKAQAAENLGLVVSCHDLGKMSVPAELFDATEKLKPNERRMMRDHSRYGAAMMEGQVSSPLLALAAGAAADHHERFDGTGYRGKAGAQISLGAQITALCDTLDSMVSARSYKEAFPLGSSLVGMTGEKLRGCYNPELLKLFIGHQVMQHRSALDSHIIETLRWRLSPPPKNEQPSARLPSRGQRIPRR